jgi:glycosyltransferase involved in cell wall biosynthesis
VFRKQKAAVDCSDLLIVPSRGMGRMLARCYSPAVRDRTLVVPWGMWRNALAAHADADAAWLRAHHHIEPETRVLMTLSRISPEKGIDLLLSALRRLERELDFDVCLFICGEPAFMRGASYGRKVRALASRLRKVRVFFPGYLSADDKQAYFKLADLFVSPSRHESYGLTIVEALQAGLAVLASDHYGVEEVLQPAYGRSVSYAAAPPETALADGLRDLLADKGRLKAMGAQARAAADGMDFSRSAGQVLSAALQLLR